MRTIHEDTDRTPACDALYDRVRISNEVYLERTPNADGLTPLLMFDAHVGCVTLHNLVLFRREGGSYHMQGMPGIHPGNMMTSEVMNPAFLQLIRVSACDAYEAIEELGCD